MKTIYFATALLAGATAVHAEQTFEGGAVGTGSQAPIPYEIAQDHLVLHIQTAYEAFATGDVASPMNGTTGSCFGSLEINKGAPDGGGKCVFKDAEGDMVVTTWTVVGFAADGALEGTYVYSGGSGKFTGATGDGLFSTLTDPATGRFQNDISGTLTLP